MMPAKSMKQIAEAFSSRGRTSLYMWLWDHYDELPEYRRYRIDWTKFTAVLSDVGLKGRDETKPLTADVVRKTFERVRRDRAAATPSAEPAAIVPTPPKGAKPTSQPGPPGGQPGGFPNPVRAVPRPRHTFQTARFKQPPEGA
jgi:hypothetical protein